jgi:hypothetical protein
LRGDLLLQSLLLQSLLLQSLLLHRLLLHSYRLLLQSLLLLLQSLLLQSLLLLLQSLLLQRLLQGHRTSGTKTTEATGTHDVVRISPSSPGLPAEEVFLGRGQATLKHDEDHDDRDEECKKAEDAKHRARCLKLK